MIDSTQNNNATNGLATALRDRSSCTIPVQPNRSLPVRPAPHIQCRSVLSKKKTKKFETQQISDETLTNDTQTPIISGSLTELSPNRTDLQQQSSPSSSTSSTSSSSSSSPLLSSRLTNHNLIRINVPNWQNDIRLPIINIIEMSSNKKNNNDSINKNTGLLLGRLSTNRKSNPDIIDKKNYSNNNNCSIIDITKSPERCVDFSMNIDSSESNCSKNESIILDDDDNDNELDRNINTPPKKRRRRKEKKSTTNNSSPIKIVPPLRLKKIQCLQENNTTDCLTDNWGSVKESIISKELKESNSNIGFRYYQPNFTPNEQIIQNDTQSPADDWSNEYRIVSEQTPSYTVDINKQSSINSELNDKKLHYHQHKLQVKLRELKKKTFMLGREMIKNAFTSPNNIVQETIDSYKKQIETLNNLLEKLPQTGINNNISIQIPELPSTIVSSSASTCAPTSISPYCDSSQSPGPPKLSPKMIIDTKIIKSPSKIRNSPPLLPKININIDNNSNHWTESDFSTHTSKNNYDNLSAVGVTTTTTTAKETNGEYIITEEIDIDDKPELLNLALNGIIKPDTNKNVVMENDEVNQLKANKSMTKTINTTALPYANPDEIIANKANNNVIEELTNQQNERITSPKITSSCDSLQNNSTNQSIIINDNAISPIEALENHLRIDSHFPSLRSWLSSSLSAKNMKNLTKYNLEQKDKNNLITIHENQLPVIQYNVNQNINQTHKTNNPTTNPRNTNITQQNININGSQWNENNNLQWQDQAQRQTQILQNSLPNAMDIPMRPSQFCQPMPISSLYTRNYPMDSCGPYTYSHPAIAATANAATNNLSLWNNGIIEYPQHQTQNISNIQTGIKSSLNNNIQQQQQQQHNIPTSSNDSVSLQQNTALPSIYRHYSSPIQSQEEITKTIPINDPTNSKIPLNNSFSKRNDYLSQSQLHSVLFSTSSNTAANVNQRLHPLSTQNNFYRYYQPQTYLQRQPPPQSIRYAEGYPAQMNYGPPWRGAIPSSAAFMPGNNYGIRSSWPLDPCNLLSTLSPVALQNYANPLDVGLPINMRGAKERVSQTRNCDTPHLGKVEYSPNTSRKLECSNCGRPNPTFKCLGCEMTFYCDESCQARHWNRHVVVCPKKMPKLKKFVL
ncbi:hypothetical protein PV325_008057 [Microctonus aethiopoides]|uniref:MYND-type domain-containing protein n=1 Tax=Microctonus aethiopoides TaxID=144406 RepID=A0AA39F0C5_9HYME|nr:hypothetical protein PV325_008057 [Microctonus aethiopoides]KAK0160919.1 hypothetical protein PV328_008275 [Microctonus aethiopoides]